jgi:type II secretory pathway component PulF
MLRPFFVVPRYMKSFQEVKVPMPGLTLLVINGYPFVTAGLLFGALGCIVVTLARTPSRAALFVSGRYLLLFLG